MRPESIYADGGIIGPRNPSQLGGVWGWCHVEGYERVIGDWGYIMPDLLEAWGGTAQVTNNTSELYAMLLALEACPDGWAGRAYTDSGVTSGRLRTFALPAGLAHKLNGVPQGLQALIRRQVERLSWESIRWHVLSGHPTREQLKNGYGKHGLPVSSHNVWCDTQCNLAKLRYNQDLARLDPNYSARPRAVKRDTSMMAARSARVASRLLATATTGGSVTVTD